MFVMKLKSLSWSQQHVMTWNVKNMSKFCHEIKHISWRHKVRYDIKRFVMVSKTCYDDKKFVIASKNSSWHVMTSKVCEKDKNMSWSQKHFMKSQNALWRQKDVMTSIRSSWCQKHIMTSKSSLVMVSKTCYDDKKFVFASNNSSWHVMTSKVCHEVNSLSWSQKLSWSQNMLWRQWHQKRIMT